MYITLHYKSKLMINPGDAANLLSLKDTICSAYRIQIVPS